MKNKIIIILILSAAMAFALDSLNMSLIGRALHGHCRAVQIEEEYVYAGAGEQFRIVNISDPDSIMLAGYCYVHGTIVDIEKSGDVAFVATNKGLFVIDVSLPGTPTVVSRLTGINCLSVFYTDSTVYLACGDEGVRIIDVTDLAEPLEIGYYNSWGTANDVFVVDSLLYLADGTAGFLTLNVSNPASMSIAGWMSTTDARSVVVDGLYAYIGDGPADIKIADLSDTFYPEVVATVAMVDLSLKVVKDSTFLYVAQNYEGLQIIDVEDPEAPVLLGTFSSESKVVGVSPYNSHVLLAEENHGFRILDVSDPSSPEDVALFGKSNNSKAVAVDSMVSGGLYAYVADGENGLVLINCDDPANPFITSTYPMDGYAHDIHIYGHWAFVADGEEGLIIVDVRNPYNPTFCGCYIPTDAAWGIFVRDSLAYVAAGMDGLTIVDVSDPTMTVEIGNYDTDWWAYGVHVSGDYAYVADRMDGVRVINVSDPTEPFEVGYYDGGGDSHGILVKPPYAYLADGDAGFRILDISDPTSPTELGHFLTETYLHGINTKASFAFLSADTAGLIAVDMSDVNFPEYAGVYNTENLAHAVEIYRDMAFLVASESGLLILDISEFEGAGTYQFKRGWNLLSYSCLDTSNLAEAFPFVTPPAYYFDPESASYVTSYTMFPGEGFWLASPTDRTALVEEYSCVGVRTDTLFPGWNLIASVANSVPVGSITTEPVGLLVTPVYGWDATLQEYYSADFFEPDKAFWVLSTGHGRIRVGEY